MPIFVSEKLPFFSPLRSCICCGSRGGDAKMGQSLEHLILACSLYCSKQPVEVPGVSRIKDYTFTCFRQFNLCLSQVLYVFQGWHF